MNGVLGGICIIIGLYFLSKTFWRAKEDQKNRAKVGEILSNEDFESPKLDKYYNAGYILSVTGMVYEGFGLLFIIYGIDLLLRN